jgi:outer membrane protein assembly factor BamB
MLRTSLLLAVIALSLAGVALGDWPQFYGPDRTGVTTDGKILHAWPAEGPKQVWKMDLGPGYGGAAIQGGKVYLLDRAVDTAQTERHADAGTQDIVRCLDLASGKEDWNYAYDAPGKLDHPGSRSTPAVDEKYVFTIGQFGHITCVDKATHKAVWAKNLVGDFGMKIGTWGVAQSPAMYKDWLIVSPQGPKAGVVALDKATGKVVWQSEGFGTVMTYASPVIATIAGVEQVVMLGMTGEPQPKSGVTVVGVDLKDGKILWNYKGWSCAIPVPSATVCPDGLVFVTGAYNAGSAMIKVTKEGESFKVAEVFKNDTCSSHNHGALLYKGNLYVNGNGRQNGNKVGLMCLGLDGTEKWKSGPTPAYQWGNIIIVDDVILALEGDGGSVLHMVQATPEGYKELASAKVLPPFGESWACMAFSDGKLVLRNYKTMVCLDLRGEK